jgi:acetoin utilization protein AcuB
MLAEDLLNQKIPPLRPSDPVAKAARWFEQLRVSQLPLVRNREFLGLVREENLADDLDPATLLVDLLPLPDQDAFVFAHQHFYHVMEAAIRHRTAVVPVLTGQNEYAGAITVNDALAAFGQMSAMRGEGSILVLTMLERDYSLTQISRYVEEEHAKILSAYATPDESDPLRLKLTLRINTGEISRIVATLERFGFHVSAQFQDRAALGPTEENDRLDSLLRYLSV